MESSGLGHKRKLLVGADVALLLNRVGYLDLLVIPKT